MKKIIVLVILVLFCSISNGQNIPELIKAEEQIQQAKLKEDLPAFLAIHQYLTSLKNLDNNYLYHYQSALVMHELSVLSMVKNEPDKQLDWIEKAMDSIKKSIEINGKYSDSHRLYSSILGIYISIKGATAGIQYGSRSTEELEFAKQLDPQNPNVYLAFGISYLNTPKAYGGDNDKAIESLKLAIQLKPNLYEAYIWLGIGYSKIGKNDEAKNQLEKALAINPLSNFARSEVEKIKKELSVMISYNNKKLSKISITNTFSVSMSKVQQAIDINVGETITKSKIEEIKNKIIKIKGIKDVQIEGVDNGDGVHLKFNIIPEGGESIFKLVVLSSIPIELGTKGEGEAIPIFPQVYYFNNQFLSSDYKLLASLSGPVFTGMFQNPTFLGEYFNYTLFPKIFAFFGGVTQYDTDGKVINQFGGHKLDVTLSVGKWLYQNKLNIAPFYRFFIGKNLEQDKTKKLPDSINLSTAGLQLYFTTLNYLGEIENDGVYFGLNAELARSKIGSQGHFDKYYFDYQQNISFSQSRLFLKLSGGLSYNIDIFEEYEHRYPIGGGFPQVVIPNALIIHGLYNNEYLAENFIIGNIGYKFPIFRKVFLEIDLDGAYVVEDFIKRFMVGSALKTYLYFFDSVPLQFIVGYGFNAKRVEKNALEILLLAEIFF